MLDIVTVYYRVLLDVLHFRPAADHLHGVLREFSCIALGDDAVVHMLGRELMYIVLKRRNFSYERNEVQMCRECGGRDVVL